ncbi:MAG: DivIVA domain-containing protein [Actinomycetota bacterium]|nr:DivIVA domain-containing protein [Actinomycetota bacterium]MDQ3681017.1 DivIVA domain-containing protein [Actinomycetota bacterium]
MDVSPETIRKVEFRERLRGYHQDDVDHFLERMAAGVEILQQRLRDASERASRAEERAQGDGGESLRQTLELAQRVAEEATQRAREEAARLVEAAQGEAQALMADAEGQAARLAEEARAEVRRLEAARQKLGADVTQMERYVAEARTRAQASLADAVRQLEHLVPDPAPLPVEQAGSLEEARDPEEPDASSLAPHPQPSGSVPFQGVPVQS